MSGSRLTVTKQVRIMTVGFLLLCVLNFWTLQVMSQDTLHRHAHSHHHSTTTESKDSSSHSLGHKRQAPLVNQHALVQVQVSMECFLEQQQQQDLTRLLQYNNAKNESSSVLPNDLMLHSSSWFVMISEVPPVNHENTETSLYINQAVDSLQWNQNKHDDSVSLVTTASLSFLIPLFATTERTLIVSLMEHDVMGNSRIATRRLLNLPVSPSMWSSTSVGTTNKRSSAVVTVDLSTRTTCTVPTTTASLENDVSRVGTKIVGMCVVLCLVVLVVYKYPNKPHQAATTGTIQQEEEQKETRTSIPQQQEKVNSRRLKRTIVIDSPTGESSSSDSSTCSSTIIRQGDNESDVRIQDSSNNNGRAQKRSLFIKPPSLVRIPYSFAAEHESLQQDDEDEESSLSVESGGKPVPPPFPSPVVDVTKDATSSENEMMESDTDKDMMPQEAQGPRMNLIQQQPAVVVEQLVLPFQAVTETSIVQDTTEADTGMMDTLEVAVQDQDTSDATGGETETEVCQDEIIQQEPPTEPASFEPETATLAVAQSTFRSHLQQQGNGGSDGCTSSSSGNSTVRQQASDEVAALADISRVGPVSDDKVDASRTTSSTLSDSATNPSPCGNVQPSGVVDASFGSFVESKVPPPPLGTEPTLESIVEDGQDSHHTVNASNKDRDSIQGKVEEESSRTTDVPLDVQDQTTDETNDDIPTGGDKDDESSAHNVEQQEATNQELESKMIDVEYVPMDESNWLKRLKERPSAITSCSVGQNDAPPPATTNDAAQEETTKPEKDELSYTSTLPPDSFGGDDFSVNDAAHPTTKDNAGTDAANEIQVASVINSDAQNMPLPQRKKRRLPPLKSRYRRDEDSAAVQQHDARPDKTDSRKQAERTAIELATALAPPATATAKPSGSAPTKPRPKKPPTDTIVPDVVPSVLLQAASKEVTDVTWNFSKAASTARRRKQEKQQRSKRRKRKAGGPPSLIILLDNDSPVPPQHHSVVSRGSSSRVPKKKSLSQQDSKKRRTL